MVHLPKQGAIGVPALPLGFSCGGVEAGGGEGFVIGILEQEKADLPLLA